MSFNLIDIILVLLVLASIINGWRRGFILGVLDLLGWALILIAGLRFYQPVAGWLRTLNIWSEVWDRPIAFILVAITVGITVQLVGYALLRRLPKDAHERPVNRALGVLPGLVNGLITAALVAALSLALPFSESIHERARESELVNRLAVYAQRLEAALHPVFAEAVAHT